MRSFAVPALVLGLSTLVAAQSLDSHHPWMRFAPGAHVTFRVTADDASSQVTQRLESVRAREFVLVSEGAGAPKREVRGAVTDGSGCLHPDAREVGKRVYRVGTREFQCAVMKLELSQGAGKLEESALVADGVALPLMITSKTSSKSWFVLKAEALDEMVTIGSRRVSCIRYAGTRCEGGRRMKVVEWRSPEVPGGLVKVVEREKTERGERREERVVVGFEGDLAADAGQLGG
jgi:hypothetical protein